MSIIDQSNTVKGSSSVPMSPSAISKNENEIGELKNEFLTLMLAQMKNQDPLNPMDGAEYATQMAQFSTVEGIQNMTDLQKQNNTLIDTLQVLQTTSLVGDKVSIPVSQIKLTEDESLKGFVELKTSAENLDVFVRDASGNVIRQVSLGSQNVGRVDFDIPDLEAGSYSIDVLAKNGGNESMTTPFLERQIEKVSIPGNGGNIQLSISGVGKLPLYSINEFLGDNV